VGSVNQKKARQDAAFELKNFTGLKLDKSISLRYQALIKREQVKQMEEDYMDIKFGDKPQQIQRTKTYKKFQNQIRG
jgi:hypothetical protein